MHPLIFLFRFVRFFFVWRGNHRFSAQSHPVLNNGIMPVVEICHLYISSGHNFFGHHGQKADNYPAIEVPSIECVSGHGIRGDRFFDYRNDYQGQITFFSLEVFDDLCRALELKDCSPGSVRRNVFVRGIDLNSLIGKEFEVQGVQFRGTGECKPCYWMNQALAPGAEEFLEGRGGLRARILSDGMLRSMPALAGVNR
ncbi:MAG TPA: MOSC domain-containing protein [Chthoniobacterales bacterium]